MAFWQLTLAISPETADALTNFLWEQGAVGVVEEEAPPAPPELRAFFADTASSSELLRALCAYRSSLRALGFLVAPGPPALTVLHDGEWASAWQQSFPPLEIGERLLIVPPWEARDGRTRGARIQVIIEPARAFGTGHHGSTEGCLRLLEDALGSDAAPPSVLDIGTGTGILAIAAVKLGAPDVLALDVDPDAIAAARMNADRNGCADRIVLGMHGPEELSAPAPFRLVLANLLAHTHLAFRSHYERVTAPGGNLVLGGILADEASQVTAALEAEGFALAAHLVIDGWASLRLRRHSGSP
jgi:ribosomal protein L11 methyltransferase